MAVVGRVWGDDADSTVEAGWVEAGWEEAGWEEAGVIERTVTLGLKPTAPPRVLMMLGGSPPPSIKAATSIVHM